MKKKINKKDLAFHIFSSVCILLSVYAFELLRRLTSQLAGDPTTKMLTSILIISLLTILNTAVIVLYEIIKQTRKTNSNESKKGGE